jgi:hypothetical protein
MAIPLNIDDLEQAKFIDDSGNVCIRVVRVASSNTSAPLSESVTDLEYGKFVEDDNGDVAVVIKSV